jgi:hypothetical protein
LGELISWLVLHQIHCGSVQLMAIVVEIWDDSMYHIAPTLTLGTENDRFVLRSYRYLQRSTERDESEQFKGQASSARGAVSSICSRECETKEVYFSPDRGSVSMMAAVDGDLRRLYVWRGIVRIIFIDVHVAVVSASFLQFKTSG